ncbi:YtkA-like [Gracilibacillus orientalis]|uniref:YtkA-like n=1 Tax=Gracilibacillus orientalis TaxID=334253 RepID=A0A1I4GXY3_9BACI|nr:FixH family protein [Gracilibacillus orientalis]SFL34864.1 YtkA-like [Gracilibacillus orientalis]
MKKRYILIILFTIALAACSSEEEVKGIHVDFELPKEAEVGESVPLQTTITYGEDELVTDAEEMKFEYWNVEDEDNSVTVEATNQEDGTYSTEVTFEEPGTYEIYAHTTAKAMHIMPKKAITITGEQQENQNHESHEETEDAEHEHQHGFEIKLNPLENITVSQEVDITVELSMDQEPYENARVRYEIIPKNGEKHDWIETEEVEPGEYVNSYSFKEAGQAEMVVHVTDDTELHEHEEFHFEVSK